MQQDPLCVLAVGNARSLHLVRWAQRLRDRGHPLHVVTNVAPRRAADFEGMAVHDIRALELLTRVPRLRRRRFGPAIRRLAERTGADVVHAHGLLPYAYWAAQAGFHPLVVSPWGRDALFDAKVEPGRSRALLAIGAADHLVVNSAAIEEASLELGADPARITQLLWHTQLAGFGPERRRPGLAQELGFPADSLVVLSLRNFQPKNNLDVLLRAFRAVQAQEPRARLVLAARGGEERAQTQALAAQLGLDDVVAFHRVEFEQLPVLAASADLVVTIASSDSSPSSLLEAMASGQALVAGWCPSIDEWVGPGEGAEMVPPRDEVAVAASLLRLLRDPDLRARHGERNRAVVRERVAEAGPGLERVYRALAARPEAAAAAAS